MINSKIEWTDHTFNPWWGCMKVSPGCKNCYAETLDNRYNHENPHWGPNSNRKPQSDKYWNQPLKWNKEAAAKGIKAKVFCASMADVFEGHPDTLPHLKRLFSLIKQTPNLIWQLLTKRPENIKTLIAFDFPDGLPENIWIGTSVENQQAADERIPHLLCVPATVRFLSIEPLLGPIILRRQAQDSKEILQATLMGKLDEYFRPVERGIDWVIVGGESGHGARPIHPEWVRSLRDQCNAANVSFFFKQWGEWVPDNQHSNFIAGIEVKSVRNILLDGSEYNDGFIRAGDLACMKKVGKKKAGRLLDGREWNEFPSLVPKSFLEP